MSIDFVIRTKLENQGIVRAENELRALFEQGESLRAQSISGRGAGLGDASSPVDAERIRQGNEALQRSIQLLQQAREQAKAAGRESAAQGDLSKAAGFERVAAGYEKQIAMLKRLQPEQQKVARNQQIINKNAQAFEGASNAQDYQKALEKVNDALRKQAILQVEAGDFKGLEGTQKAIQDVDAFSNELKNLQGEEEAVSGITSIMNSKFNQFGFTLFITISTIQQLVNGMQQMFDTALDGAQAADRIQSFAFALQNVGLNANNIRNDLRQASQGIVDMDTAMKGTIQLLKSGLPEAAEKSDELLKIATNAALVSGEVEKADEIYQKLIRGIVRASPRLIDDADILLKLGDAYGAYADQMGITGRELTVVEQKMATLNAVMEEGKRIEELAEGFDSFSQPLKEVEVGLKEAGTNLKIFFGVMAAGVAETTGVVTSSLRDGLIQTLVDSGIMTQQSASLMMEAWGSFGSFVGTIIGALGSTLGAFFEIVINGAKLMASALVLPVELATTLAQLVAGTIDLATANDKLANSLGNVAENGSEALDSIFTGGHFIERMDGWMERFGINTGKTSDEVAGLTDALSDMESSGGDTHLTDRLSDMEKALEAAIDARTGIDAQHRDRLEDAREAHADKMESIEENLADRLLSIRKTYIDKMADISEKGRERATKIAEDAADKLRDIEEDLAESLSSSSDQAREDRVDAQNDRNEQLEDIAEDHQKKLADIERKAQLDRMKALIDRDARALFEAEQSRKEDIRDANEDAKEKQKDANDSFKERIDEINKNEEEERRNAIEAAEKKRRDAREAQAKALADLKESLEKQKREAIKSAKESRRDAIASAKEQRQDAKESYRDQLDDIREWYRDQQAAQKEANMREKINELKHLAEMGELTEDHLNELGRMHSEYRNFVNSDSTNPGSIGYNPGGSGSPGSGSGQIPIPRPDANPDERTGTITPPGGGRVGSFQRVELTVNNDKTLEQILKEVSYEAITEVIS